MVEKLRILKINLQTVKKGQKLNLDNIIFVIPRKVREIFFFLKRTAHHI